MSDIKFEEALKHLEEIVEQLEQGETPLEETILKFQEGLKFARICKEKLKSAEKDILKVTKEGDGDFQLTILQ